MLINFTDSYINEILAAYNLIGGIQCSLSKREPFMGNSVVLDPLYAHSILLSGIIDHLEYDDNTEPKSNEALLLCLRKLLNMDLCLAGCVPNLDVKNYHNASVVLPQNR
jgi:hypothetical protein